MHMRNGVPASTDAGVNTIKTKMAMARCQRLIFIRSPLQFAMQG